jgi:undecaprenyl-diphosphatase
MAFFEWINQIDTQLFLNLNGCNSNFFDWFFTFFTSKEVWFPLYLLMVVLFVQKYRLQAIWVVLFFVLAIVISDQLSGLIKDLVARQRPTHIPAIAHLINAPAGKGGAYGFVSSHAANSFALTFLLGLLVKRRWLWLALVLWALLTSYSRIYVGVHYPFDVICGGILGALIGWGVYKLLVLFDFRFQRKRITNAGQWKLKHTQPIFIALVFITITLLVVSFLMGKYS